jgi:hypothetical protein
LKNWLAFRSLGTIFGTGILSILHSNRIERSPHNVVPNSGEILDTSTAN